jgi:hypothetical protein
MKYENVWYCLSYNLIFASEAGVAQSARWLLAAALQIDASPYCGMNDSHSHELKSDLLD